jgi:hypothetical protein
MTPELSTLLMVILVQVRVAALIPRLGMLQRQRQKLRLRNLQTKQREPMDEEI